MQPLRALCSVFAIAGFLAGCAAPGPYHDQNNDPHPALTAPATTLHFLTL